MCFKCKKFKDNAKKKLDEMITESKINEIIQKIRRIRLLS